MCANCGDPNQPYNDATRPAWVAKAVRRLEERLAGAPPTPAEQAASDSLRADWAGGNERELLDRLIDQNRPCDDGTDRDEARFEGSMLHAEMTVGMGMAGFDVPTDPWILDIQEKLYQGTMTLDEARRLIRKKHGLGEPDA